MTRLAGQVALVTHATGHTNSAIARRLAAEGACVVISHTDDADGAARLVADIVWRGGCAVAVGGDITRWPVLRQLFDTTTARFGRLDILVNDARHADDDGLFGAMLICQEAIRQFGSTGGAIITLAAPARCAIVPEATTDNAADVLTLGLSRALRGRNIAVHAIAPEPRTQPEITVIDAAARVRPMEPTRMTPEAVARLAADLVAAHRQSPPLLAAG